MKGIVLLLAFLVLPVCFRACSIALQFPLRVWRTFGTAINLSAWFAQVYDPKGYTKEHFESWNTAADIALIKSAGFDHVRLSVNPQPMMDAQSRRQNRGAEYFGYLDAAMKMILDAGLAVELDMHPESDFKERLAKEDDFVQRFADFWSTVAQHYASYDAGSRLLRDSERTGDARPLPLVWRGNEAGGGNPTGSASKYDHCTGRELG